MDSRTLKKKARLCNNNFVSRRFQSHFQRCSDALDGVAILIRKPYFMDCADTASCEYRKGYYAIPEQAICDSKYRFTFFFLSVHALRMIKWHLRAILLRRARERKTSTRRRFLAMVFLLGTVTRQFKSPNVRELQCPRLRAPRLGAGQHILEESGFCD